MVKTNEKEIKKALEGRVKAGVAFLNVMRPGWPRKINLRKLDLSDPNICVIGELEGDYWEGIENLGISVKNNDLGYAEASEVVPQAMGFTLDPEEGLFADYNSDWYDMDAPWTWLTSIWKKQIAKLKAKKH